jgi:hypothetical protein
MNLNISLSDMLLSDLKCRLHNQRLSWEEGAQNKINEQVANNLAYNYKEEVSDKTARTVAEFLDLTKRPLLPREPKVIRWRLIQGALEKATYSFG